jgi:hypothetical protein
MVSAQSSVVPSPSKVEPPNASARLPTFLRANAVSTNSMAGTRNDESSIAVAANAGALRQLGGRAEPNARTAASSQHIFNARSAMKPAIAKATPPTRTRESWLDTSS